MEVQKTREELLAFLRLNTNDTSTLRDFIVRENAAAPFDATFLGTPNESSAESDAEMVEEVREEGRDDEDFIMLLHSKGKKKSDKKMSLMKPSAAKAKRKCEFCGTIDTPMWRRGPTGKGTLCNACGVKWSLKFRKRAGKKPVKLERPKEEPREQRVSSRKRSPKGPLEGASPEVSSAEAEPSRKRKDEAEVPTEAQKRPKTLPEEEAPSQDSPPSSHQLLGKLLNVVEVQLVEEEELEKVKRGVSSLREELNARESQREKEFEQTRANAINEVMEFRRDFAAISSPLAPHSAHSVAQACSEILEAYSNSLRGQIRDMRGSSDPEWTKKLDQVQASSQEMVSKVGALMSSLVNKAAADSAQWDKICQQREENIRSGWTFLHKEAKSDYSSLHAKLDALEQKIR